MDAWVVLAFGASVVSILAGLSGVAPISRPEPEARRSREPVMPRLPPEVIAVLNRNALRVMKRRSYPGSADPPSVTAASATVRVTPYLTSLS
jgi:hypothetical protein